MNELSSDPQVCLRLATNLVCCEGAYSENTLRGYRNDLKHFQAWCASRELGWLPAAPQTIADFVDTQLETKAISTIKHRVDAIRFAHRMADLPSPTDNSTVYLALRRARRARHRRPKQSAGLTSELLGRIVAACPRTLSGLRDAALLSVGYDTLCRSYELAAMNIEHLNENCSRIRVPVAKSDPFGDGRIAYLSTATATLVNAWLSASDLHDGPLFHGLHTRKLSDRPLDTSSIRRLIKTAAKRAGLEPATVRSLSGHSMRVGGCAGHDRGRRRHHRDHARGGMKIARSPVALSRKRFGRTDARAPLGGPQIAERGLSRSAIALH